MNNKYEEIDIMPGSNIKEAVNELLEYNKKGKLVCCTFNGHILYSDTVNYENAFKKITGHTVKEYEDITKKNKEAREREKLEFQKSLPTLIDGWIERGKRILNQEKHQEWIRIVPIRANDLYEGMELDACLDIIEILNNYGSFEDAKQAIKNQNHSGMSFSLVCSMIQKFCECGEDFVKYIE